MIVEKKCEWVKNSSFKKAVLITGATGVGKSRLAHDFYAEGDLILNADSRQMLKGLDIGTSKPTLLEQKKYRYSHLNHLSPYSNGTSAFDFLKSSLKVIDDFYAKNFGAEQLNHIYIVGGASLYTEVFLNGIAEIPKVSPQIREQLLRVYAEEGMTPLLEELKQKDKAYYLKVDKKNPVRVLRALEVIRFCGKTFTELRFTQVPPPLRLLVLVPMMSREKLYQKIETRVDQMLENGWVEEVEQLLAEGVCEKKLSGVIGYKEIVVYLKINKRSSKHSQAYKTMREKIKVSTRHYAKRQVVWLKRTRDAIFLWEGESLENEEDRWLGKLSLKNFAEVKAENFLGQVKIKVKHFSEAKVLADAFYDLK